MKLQVTAKKTIKTRYAVVFMGVKLAVAFNRDSGAKVGHDARMISGDITSGGSRVNWHCSVAEGSVFEIKVDDEFFSKNHNRIKNWEMKEIADFTMTIERSKALEEMESNLE